VSNLHAFDRLGVPVDRVYADDGALLVATPYGGQILQWASHSAAPQGHLFVASLANARDGTAIRGGVPVIFPQFGMRGPIQQRKHGFARNANWVRVWVGSPAGDACIRYVLDDSRQSDPQWPHQYLCSLTATANATQLRIELAIANLGAETFTFTTALHTYLFAVTRLEAVALRGLQGSRYVDSANGDEERIDTNVKLQFQGEVDRIYATSDCVHLETDKGCLRLDSSGFADTVVWNPGSEKAASLADLGAGDDQRFICVEPGCVLTPVALEAGDVWRAHHTITLE
jgi:glucose-6-phosphate 1-epimerase